MRPFILAAVSLAVASAACALPFIVQPPAPDTHSFVSVTVGGAWPDSCVPTAVETSINSTLITLVVQPVVQIEARCAPVTTAWNLTANIGLLPPATYAVHVFLQGSITRVDLGSELFTVRPAEPFAVVPAGGPVSGGTQVRLVSQYSWPTTQVVFGDAPAVTAKQSGHTLIVTAPPHAAGTVDVKVGLQSATGAFTYFDPAQPPDPSIFEPLLFPLAFSGAGAYGSSWVTDNYISAPPADTAVFFEQLPCGSCSQSVSKLVRLDAESPAGVVLHAARGTLGSAALSSRIRDLSRQAESAGTEIPVVRESDWRLGSVRLTNIPSDPNSRTMLRIWADHDTPVSVSIEASVRGHTLWTAVEKGLTRQANGLLYCQIDLGELAARIPGTDPRDVTITYLAFDPDVRIWALATVTNNQTQHVTAIWPQ